MTTHGARKQMVEKIALVIENLDRPGATQLVDYGGPSPITMTSVRVGERVRASIPSGTPVPHGNNDMEMAVYPASHHEAQHIDTNNGVGEFAPLTNSDGSVNPGDIGYVWLQDGQNFSKPYLGQGSFVVEA